MKKKFEGWWFLACGGALIAFGIDLMPSKGIAWLLGIASIVFGVYLIAVKAACSVADLPEEK